MKKLLFFLCIALLLSGCANVSLVSWEARKVEVAGQKENILNMATGTMNNAIQSREYLLLYNTVYNNAIPASILSRIGKNDRLAVIMSERDTLEYADFMHLFVSAVSRNLVNAGYQVVDMRPASRKFGLEQERLLRSVDKLLVLTVWEAGSRSVVFEEKASVFTAYQVNMDLVEAKSNLLLASTPVFGSTRNDFDKSEFDRFQHFTLTEVNADLPLIYADNRKKGVLGLLDEQGGRQFVLTVNNPSRLPLNLKITDIYGSTLFLRDITFTEDLAGNYCQYVWDGILNDGTPISKGDYMLFLRDSSGMFSSQTRFRVE